MRKQCEKLIFGGVGVDELAAQSDVACLVLYEVKHALDCLIGRLKPQKRDVHKMSHATFVLKRLLDQLKRRAERKNALNCIRRRDLNVFIARADDVAVVRQLTKTLCHVREGFVRLREFLRNRIDERDSDWHIGENFFIENHFTLDATGCFGLTTIKNPAKPGEDGCEGHQPGCERGHEANEIADGFVGDSLGLFDHRDPSSR